MKLIESNYSIFNFSLFTQNSIRIAYQNLRKPANVRTIPIQLLIKSSLKTIFSAR